MNSADKIKRLFKDAELGIDPDTDEKIFKDVLQARQMVTKKVSAMPEIWRILMKNPMTKIAAAAVITIACVTGLKIWTDTGSGIALADVLARMEQAKAVWFKTTDKIFASEDPNELWLDSRHTMLVSQEYGTKRIRGLHDPNGEEMTEKEAYWYPHQRITMISIDHTQKTYKRRVIAHSQVQNERLLSQEDIITSLKDILPTEHESIGRSIIEGIEVEGFKATDSNSHNKYWVDVKTLLPVRVEHLFDLGLRGGDTRMSLQRVYFAFQWDIPVDASTFEAPPIPDGYAIQDKFPELANEENTIEGFKQCLELFDNYPEKIDLTILWAESEKSETIAALQLKEELKGLTGLDRDNKKMDALKPIRFLNKFYIELAKKDSAYYGNNVTPKDTDKVLMRWKVSDNEYRVIYGDLHTETITPEKLTELEAALPK